MLFIFFYFNIGYWFCNKALKAKKLFFIQLPSCHYLLVDRKVENLAELLDCQKEFLITVILFLVLSSQSLLNLLMSFILWLISEILVQLSILINSYLFSLGWIVDDTKMEEGCDIKSTIAKSEVYCIYLPILS